METVENCEYVKGIQEYLVLLQNKKLLYNIKKWNHAVGDIYISSHVIPTVDLWGRIALFYRGGNWGLEKLSDVKE